MMAAGFRCLGGRGREAPSASWRILILNDIYIMAMMDKWDRLLVGLPVGGYEILGMEWNESRRFFNRARVAKKYGYVFCVTHLHDEKYYVEKLIDGDEGMYLAAVRRRPGKGEDL